MPSRRDLAELCGAPDPSELSNAGATLERRSHATAGRGAASHWCHDKTIVRPTGSRQHDVGCQRKSRFARRDYRTKTTE